MWQRKRMAERSGRDVWELLLVAILPVLVYANSLNNPFHYDDIHSIVENVHIRRLANIPLFFVDPSLFSENPDNAMYRPLLLVTFAANHAVSGYEVWSYHLLGLVLHMGCSYMLFEIGALLLRQRRAAAFAALIFALHPVNTESLNYISSRSEVLSALWLLAGFWAFLRYRLSRARPIWPALALAAGVLSKSSAIVLPAICLAYDLVCTPRKEGEKVKIYAGMALIAVAYVAVVWKFLARAAVGAPVRCYDEQVWSQVKAAVLYIKLLLWPSGLSVDHQFLVSDTLFDPFAASAFAFLCSLLILAYHRRRRHPLLLFLLSFAFISLAPSCLIPLNVLVNEHRLYLPSAAFALALAYGARRVANRGDGWSRAVQIAALATLAVYSIATVQRNQVWGSEYALWQDAVDKGGLMARPHFYLAEAHYKRGESGAAIKTYEKGLERDPNFAVGWARLGQMYEESGLIDRAEKAYRRGVQADSEQKQAWSGLADSHRLQGDMEEASAAYLRLLELDPDDAIAHNNLGNVYQVLDQAERALPHHLRAVELDATSADIYVSLGTAYLMLGDMEKAKTTLGQAVELDPRNAGAWNNLAYVEEEMGNASAALDAYRRAAALDDHFAQRLESRIRALQEAVRD